MALAAYRADIDAGKDALLVGDSLNFGLTGASTTTRSNAPCPTGSAVAGTA